MTTPTSLEDGSFIQEGHYYINRAGQTVLITAFLNHNTRWLHGAYVNTDETWHKSGYWKGPGDTSSLDLIRLATEEEVKKLQTTFPDIPETQKIKPPPINSIWVWDEPSDCSTDPTIRIVLPCLKTDNQSVRYFHKSRDGSIAVHSAHLREWQAWSQRATMIFAGITEHPPEKSENPPLEGVHKHPSEM